MTSIVDDTTVDDETQPREHAYFEKADEFLEHLKTLIGVDLFSDEEATEEERNAIRRVQMICGEYHEQSYLWDPWLEQIVGPPIEALRQHAARVVESADKDPATVRANWLAEATYQIVNTRGSKIIVSFFPHQVSDLSVAIAYMQRLEPSGSRGAWAIRYIVLLWLSLICRLPFDLSNFDPEGGESGSTADTIEAIGLQYLDKAGLERDAAALLLARLYARQDTHTRFKNFLDQSEPHLVESPNLFRALGAMQVFTEILKSGGLDQLALHLPQILELAQKLPHNTSLSVHTVIRKYVIKVSGRVGLKLLPHTPTNRITIRTLHGETISPNEGFASSTESEAEIPDEIEGIIDDMLNGLRDRDTTIRWSAAKYIARIGSSVPNDLTSQLLDAILDIYQTHFVEGGELNTAAEPSWHGATLACAEFARQGLISGNNVPKTVNWVLKALFFDVKKGTHSIGSNVRDAACYFLWSLPRTLDPNAMRPYATRLAQSLITLALFDREVHIRRAASAAFQENVGRMGLFPHGIEVLKWIDFYGVGVRRNSFVVSAPEVARHEVYRGHLLNYLVDTTLKHWDPDMRSIGAEALKELCKADIYTLAPPVVERLKGSLAFVDSHEIHGAILGLREIAEGLREEQDGERSTKFRAQIFELLDRLTDSSIKGYKNDLLLEATSQLIGSSLSDIALNARPNLDVKSPPKWRFILDLCLKHRSDVVQDAGSRAVGMLSELRSSERDIDQ
ncbi:hypothetical protein FRC19_000490 [Serendipita sp. 401]|nr:hypothetical protein FRC19_000490 [Serendipita sp. 401]KAG9057416.1 hypothetical protein FS842_006894 [Serendipita sp. 407]